MKIIYYSYASITYGNRQERFQAEQVSRFYVATQTDIIKMIKKQNRCSGKDSTLTASTRFNAHAV